jgi:hypothetical protein
MDQSGQGKITRSYVASELVQEVIEADLSVVIWSYFSMSAGHLVCKLT